MLQIEAGEVPVEAEHILLDLEMGVLIDQEVVLKKSVYSVLYHSVIFWRD